MKNKNEGLNPSTLRKVLRKAKRTMICQQHSTVLICCGPVLVQVSPDFYRAHLADLYPVTLHGPVSPVCFYNMEQGTALHVCPVRVNNETFKQLYEQYGGCNNG